MYPWWALDISFLKSTSAVISPVVCPVLQCSQHVHQLAG